MTEPFLHLLVRSLPLHSQPVTCLLVAPFLCSPNEPIHQRFSGPIAQGDIQLWNKGGSTVGRKSIVSIARIFPATIELCSGCFSILECCFFVWITQIHLQAFQSTMKQHALFTTYMTTNEYRRSRFYRTVDEALVMSRLEQALHDDPWSLMMRHSTFSFGYRLPGNFLLFQQSSWSWFQFGPKWYTFCLALLKSKQAHVIQ